MFFCNQKFLNIFIEKTKYFFVIDVLSKTKEFSLIYYIKFGNIFMSLIFIQMIIKMEMLIKEFSNLNQINFYKQF